MKNYQKIFGSFSNCLYICTQQIKIILCTQKLITTVRKKL